MSPTDQKYAESSKFSQFFYYRLPGKFRQRDRSLKCDAKNSTCISLPLYIDITLPIIDIDFLYQFNQRVHHFWFFFNVRNKMFFKSWQVPTSVLQLGYFQWEDKTGVDTDQYSLHTKLHFKCTPGMENYCILMQMSLKYVHMCTISKKVALVHIIAWRKTGLRTRKCPIGPQCRLRYIS